jgi:translation initiation factor 2 subunit 3
MYYQQFMNDQPIFNIGMLGHVANGKSTITKAITATSTQKHSSEKKNNNITIKLGYANAKIYKCIQCESPSCYQSFSSDTKNPLCKINNEHINLQLQTHVSFIDCPGHNMLMSTMLNGTCLMNAAMIVESCSYVNPNISSKEEKFIKAQTVEHLIAAEIMGIDNFMVALNKVDLVSRKIADKNMEILKDFIVGTAAENTSIIPVSANFGINIDVICKYICEKMPIPKPLINLNNDIKPKMIIIRSFSINKPGVNVFDLSGGVLGGSIVEGILSVGMDILIKPGFIEKINNDTNNPLFKYIPIKSKVLSLNSENNKLEKAIPGGLIGVSIDIDSSVTKNDLLVGQLLGTVDNLPDVYDSLKISFKQLAKIVFDDEEFEQTKCTIDEIIKINVNASNIHARITKIYKNKFLEIKLLDKPVCANIGDKLSIMRNIKKSWRLVGYGNIKSAQFTIL